MALVTWSTLLSLHVASRSSWWWAAWRAKYDVCAARSLGT